MCVHTHTDRSTAKYSTISWNRCLKMDVFAVITRKTLITMSLTFSRRYVDISTNSGR